MLYAGCETTDDRRQKTEDGGRIEDKHEIRSSKYSAEHLTVETDSNDRNTKYKRDSAYSMLDADVRISSPVSCILHQSRKPEDFYSLPTYSEIGKHPQ
jgi:hypothetical protein